MSRIIFSFHPNTTLRDQNTNHELTNTYFRDIPRWMIVLNCICHCVRWLGLIKAIYDDTKSVCLLSERYREREFEA